MSNSQSPTETEGYEPLPFDAQCPGVVALPTRTISFFNIRPRGTATDSSPMVKVSIATGEVGEMKVGDVLVVDGIEVHLTRLDDPETTPLPVGGYLVPTPSSRH